MTDWLGDEPAEPWVEPEPVFAHDVPVETLEDACWAWAKGSYPIEAAVLLLTHHDLWLRRAPLRHYITLSSGWDAGHRAAVINFDWIIKALDDPDSVKDDSAVIFGSGGEVRLLRLAAGLSGQDDTAVSLGDVLCGLDDRTFEIALAALAHCHQGFDRPSKYPWPLRP